MQTEMTVEDATLDDSVSSNMKLGVTHDIGFKRGDDQFRYHVAGLIIEDGDILMVGNAWYGYFYCIGGVVRRNEGAHDACVRNVYEETGEYFVTARLIFIHENFFMRQDPESRSWAVCHELGFYFLMKRGNESYSESLHSFFAKKKNDDGSNLVEQEGANGAAERGELDESEEAGMYAGNAKSLKWIPIKDYAKYNAHPRFFAQKLDPLPSTYEYVFTTDERFGKIRRDLVELGWY
jgi:ADP-ribose pyrophosphatase YjhB (NUDIX family)